MVSAKRGALDVFGDHVGFQIHFIAGFELRKVCHFPGFRNDGDFKIFVRQRRNREADAFHRNRALENEITRHVPGVFNTTVHELVIDNTRKLSARINVTLNDMAAETGYGRNRALEVYGAARLQTTQRRSLESFARNVGRKRVGLESSAVKNTPLTEIDSPCFVSSTTSTCLDRDVGVFAARLDAAHATKFFNDSSKHVGDCQLPIYQFPIGLIQSLLSGSAAFTAGSAAFPAKRLCRLPCGKALPFRQRKENSEAMPRPKNAFRIANTSCRFAQSPNFRSKTTNRTIKNSDDHTGTTSPSASKGSV